MKNLATAYTYNPTAKTLTLTGLNVPLSYLLLVVNATRGTIIYNLADPSLAAANFVQGANSVLTLNSSVDTSFHNAADALTIFYDDGIQSNAVLIQGPVGPAGPKGDTGDPGSTEISGITGLQDALNEKSDLLQPTVIANLSENLIIPAARNQFYKITYNSFQSYTATLPEVNVKTGDIVAIGMLSDTGRSLAIRHLGSTIHNIGSGEYLILIAQSNGASWIIQQGVTRHTHSNFFVPLTSSDPSIAGFVPGPTFSDRGKFLSAQSGNPWKTLEIADTTGLQSALDAKASTSHKSSHATGGTDALTPAEIGAATANHTHDISEITISDEEGTVPFKDAWINSLEEVEEQITDLQTALDAKASTSALAALEADTTGLQAALDTKAPAVEFRSIILSQASTTSHPLASGRHIFLRVQSFGTFTGEILLPRRPDDAAQDGDELFISTNTIAGTLAIKRYLFTGSDYASTTETIVSVTGGRFNGRFRLTDRVWEYLDAPTHDRLAALEARVAALEAAQP